MSYAFFKKLLPVLGVVFVAASVNAAETTINGFASIVGGKALNSVELPNGEESRYVADRGYATTEAGAANKNAIYGDHLSYRPDSNYGLQIKSDLNRDLTVTAQLTGRGAQDFETELEWVYMSYDLTSSFTVQAGRQRIPLYYYSDFVDVGYAYHWVRPPVDVYSNTLRTYEGVSLIHNGQLGNWTTKTRVYTGTTSNKTSRFGNFSSDGIMGAVFNVNNEWLRLRASVIDGEFYIGGNPLTGEDNPQDGQFVSLAANLTLGNGFVMAEATGGKMADDGFLVVSSNGEFVPLDELGSLMLTAGYQFGDFTPHISYSDSNVNFSPALDPSIGDWYIKTETLTAGLRWDFHPSAAFKIEYASTADTSHDGVVFVRGKVDEVDVITFGVDLLF
ncbi:hypothetical protein [Teredinibacter franksiae]|uniref:hypothetical protein n=1 Tax=Teredinibacter franksiae TaxID=2761453 RepID=UPI001625AA5C|nr:hypothetical protein [Teredinibacter franksiae]